MGKYTDRTVHNYLRIMTIVPVFIIFFLFLPGSYSGADSFSSFGEFTVESSANWESGELTIVIHVPLDQNNRIIPSAKNAAERKIRGFFNEILKQELLDVPVDSSSTIKDRIFSDPAFLESLSQLSTMAIPRYTHLSRDLKTLTLRYDIPFYPDMASYFIPHVSPVIQPVRLDFIPSTRFSGILVYVDQTLPLYGKNINGTFTPSFFPRIFDENMNLLAEIRMVDPATAARDGMVKYTANMNSIHGESRIGRNPLRTSAIALFGSNNTDLIIPNQAAAQILSREENLQLIRDGRILIMCRLPD